MGTEETSFQAFADEVVDHVVTLAGLDQLEVEVFFCIQQVAGPDPGEVLAYMLRKGGNDAFLATDARGRMWSCDCGGQSARETTPGIAFVALGDEMLGALGCPAPRGEAKCH